MCVSARIGLANFALARTVGCNIAKSRWRNTAFFGLTDHPWCWLWLDVRLTPASLRGNSAWRRSSWPPARILSSYSIWKRGRPVTCR